MPKKPTGRQRRELKAALAWQRPPEPLPQPPPPAPLPAPVAPPVVPAPPSRPARPMPASVRAWDSVPLPSPPAVALQVLPSPPSESLSLGHPVHQLRPEQWVLLELVRAGMNAGLDSFDAYRNGSKRIDEMAEVARRIMEFRVES